MRLAGWGNFPCTNADSYEFRSDHSLKNIVDNQSELIARGNGRSYGDSAIAPVVVETKKHHNFLKFDDENGLIQAQSGLLLAEILDIIVPRGWFLKVTPGTKLITLGGAIASDVHGKNHHMDGCFSECVIAFHLMLADGSIINCSKEVNSEIFKATCGGMGLTGIILDATISLKRIHSSNIVQKTIRSQNLKATFNAFEEYKNTQYSVAWIDCLASGKHLGRSLLMLGDFANDGNLNYQTPRKVSIPLMLPSFILNNASVSAFNFCYFHKPRTIESEQLVTIDSFFYPLDMINNWNRLYGKNGFIQYQIIIPKEHSYVALQRILFKIASFGKGSFLAVLKLYGPVNENYLSFPIEGYSLAVDFKIEPGIFEFLNRLDKIVLEYGGRHYLAKDSRVSKEVFEQGYPKLSEFKALRSKFKMDKKFNSLQSERLGI